MDFGRLVRSVLVVLALAVTANSLQQIPDAREDGGKVLVELYSESLCPFCANFVTNYLSKFFTNGLIDIVDLKIIPYGNAKIEPSGKFKCQHGPDECTLNLVQACAIKLWPEVDEWFPFINCLESLPRRSAATEWKTCETGLNLTQIEQCYKGPLGYEFELEYAEITNKLEPPHTYVPWVLVNGQPLYEEYEDIVKYVCSAYTGTKKLPKVCSENDSIIIRGPNVLKLPSLRLVTPVV